MEDDKWITAVALRQLGDALEQIQSKTEVSETTLEDLDILNKVMENLRDKHYFHASELINRLETDIVDKGQLKNEIDLLKEASRAINSHKPAKAIELLGGIGSSLTQAEKYTLLGTANVYSNQNEQAMQNLKKAIAYDPKHFRAMTNIGNLNLEANKIEQAIVDYQNALKINDASSSALHNLGVAYRKKGQITKSVNYLKQAQRAKNKELKEEARETMKSGENKKAMKYVRYFFFAITALAIIAIAIRQLT